MPWILVFFLLAILEKITDVACIRLADIYWNASNPIFRIDNTDHIIDVNKGNIPFEYDQVNIICPVYDPGTNEEDVEQYVIYNVSKEEYDSCRITNPDPRIIAVCDKPQQVMYFTITFRSFTPQPGGLEFRPGQDYYFISTSTGGQGGLHQRIGGRCATHNMKVIFKVCCDPSKRLNIPTTSSKSSTATSTASSHSSGAPFFSTSSSSSRALSTTTPASTSVKSVFASSTLVPPFWLRPFTTSRPPYKTYEVPIDGGRKKSSKKSEDRDKLPNETRAKNEELVNNAYDRCRSTLVTCLTLLVVALLGR